MNPHKTAGDDANSNEKGTGQRAGTGAGNGAGNGTAATTETTPVIPLPLGTARTLTAGGALLSAASTFLPWTWTTDFPGNLTVTGYPGGLQLLTLTGALLTLLYALTTWNLPGTRWLNPTRSHNATALLATATLATTWYTLIAIALQLGGLVNLEPGGYAAALTTLTTLLGTLALPLDRRTTTSFPPTSRLSTTRTGTALRSVLRTIRPGPTDRRPPPARPLPAWTEILIIAASFGLALGLVTYGIGTAYGELFTGFLLLAGFGAAALARAGLIARLTALTTKHRTPTITAAFAAAALFPLTQDTDQYTLIAVNILIFSTVALGLNVVVGLAGLLDLGYVAFLGVGAYTAALVSGTTASTLDIRFPFWAAVLTGAAASLIFGVVIGAPTLRLRGDYLAIVTLGFGEIFRITVGNLNGESGPSLTNGPNGIPNIPDLALFGYDFGETHTLGGITLNPFANYYLLMLLFTVIVVLIFSRAGDSRIGRAWIAIREDETAATAMGINGFRLKLLAFALGATLAGLAGTVQAHVAYTVVPEQYVFAGPVPPNSAFLLAAVILGGMGTISGPLLGAALLYLIPAKLQFLHDYQLLAFGAALILLMRFRPEGLIPDRRRQLEFHEGTTGSSTLTHAEATTP
ncbi:branched-chain amino acid ABC transporter permease [Streptomyces telluris]|uniref:Branched-chain amino acid ABC transporter permease n=1 Tax=Streptomyces telluris TaxID=2720021 RepID=A0A9X2LHX3_9ACTN|nr:branched-chain amino acid ABC transporter permease [Streptomyces telluris]MCQ8771550.1 branched-chain amino acid ABC transporter permease [Streptomyces telluris]NJP78552.1 branched-chain amino acid ABC transporter permease [Streptomyces telluris]